MSQVVNGDLGICVRYSDGGICHIPVAVACLELLVINRGIKLDVVGLSIAHKILELALSAQLGAGVKGVCDLLADIGA